MVMGRSTKILACALSSGVVLAVMVPVSIFVIIPRFGQHGIDSAVLTLSNSTLIPCLTPYVELQNTFTLTSTTPILSVTVSEIQMTQTTYMCPGNTGGYSCDNPNATVLGTFINPEMHLKPGSNKFYEDVGTRLVDINQMLNGFLMPLVIGKEINLTLSSDDVTVTALGFIKIRKLTMVKNMTCKLLSQTSDAPIPASKFCDPTNTSADKIITGRRLAGTFGYTMTCTPGFSYNSSAVLV
jgi:hypothetical protein